MIFFEFYFDILRIILVPYQIAIITRTQQSEKDKELFNRNNMLAMITFLQNFLLYCDKICISDRT